MPDQPSPRRRFQFSLRLALLLMTLACVVASLIRWRLYIARLDDEVRWIEMDQGHSNIPMSERPTWPPSRGLLP